MVTDTKLLITQYISYSFGQQRYETKYENNKISQRQNLGIYSFFGSFLWHTLNHVASQGDTGARHYDILAHNIVRVTLHFCLKTQWMEPKVIYDFRSSSMFWNHANGKVLNKEHLPTSLRSYLFSAIIIIISSFLYGALNIHLFVLYKQTAE